MDVVASSEHQSVIDLGEWVKGCRDGVRRLVVGVDDQYLFDVRPRSRDDLTLLIHCEALAVKDELVLTTDGVHGDKVRVGLSHTLRSYRFAFNLAASYVGRGVGRDDDGYIAH
jgi:hypothetical protein